MATIEERAEKYANKLRDEAYSPAHGFVTCDYEPEEYMSDTEYEYSLEGYINGATDQDRIARQEERERCIKAAQDAHCKCCIHHEDCRVLNPMIIGVTYPCNDRDEIRKAMEGGEV